MRFTKEGLDILLGNKQPSNKQAFKSPPAPAFGKKEGK